MFLDEKNIEVRSGRGGAIVKSLYPSAVPMAVMAVVAVT